MKTPKQIFELMYNNDPFSKLLGMQLIAISEGHCKLEMKVTKDMLNGFSIAHGGITYSLADSALAFALLSFSSPTSVGILSIPQTANSKNTVGLLVFRLLGHRPLGFKSCPTPIPSPETLNLYRWQPSVHPSLWCISSL